MPYYKSRPVIVHAVKWNGPGDHPAVEFRPYGHNDELMPQVQNIHGHWVKVESGDYIVREPNHHNRYYPAHPAVFEAKYEVIENQQEDRFGVQMDMFNGDRT